MKRDFFSLRWLTRLEDLERLEEPTRQDYRGLFEKLLDDFDDVYQCQELRHKKEIAILENRIYQLVNARKDELEPAIVDSLITCYNLPVN